MCINFCLATADRNKRDYYMSAIGTAIGDVRPAYCPATPQKVEELGIPQSLLQDLVLRRLALDGTSDLQSLSRSLKLSLSVVDGIFRIIRQQQLVEVKGMVGNDYMVTLSA